MDKLYSCFESLLTGLDGVNSSFPETKIYLAGLGKTSTLDLTPLELKGLEEHLFNVGMREKLK